jgi:hypothetical protein
VREIFFFILPALLMLAIPEVATDFCRAQDKPDRPPRAQKSKGDATAKASEATNDDAQDPGAQRGRIRVNVNLVNVLVSVLDEHNRPAPDLPREAFQLFEEGAEQKIEVFESETQLPLDLVLMVDSSLSAHKEIAFEEEAGPLYSPGSSHRRSPGGLRGRRKRYADSGLHRQRGRAAVRGPPLAQWGRHFDLRCYLARFAVAGAPRRRPSPRHHSGDGRRRDDEQL